MKRSSMTFHTLTISFFAFLALTANALAQSTSPVLLQIGNRYGIQPDIVYGVANNTPLKLDIWNPRDKTELATTVVYFHGGGWAYSSKEGAVYQLLPYLERGWRVVNVGYRLSSNSLAPAAVEDTRCALRWVFRNAAQYKFDTSKIILAGQSAGGHLALITGMLPDGSPLENRCFADKRINDVPMKVAAIINWYGITDVNDLIQGPNQKNYAMMWMGSLPNAAEVAKSVSPLTYVRAGLPPIFTVHGDKDELVPHAQAVRLHDALTKAGDVNKLITIKDGRHGGFSQADYIRLYDELWKLLRENGID